MAKRKKITKVGTLPAIYLPRELKDLIGKSYELHYDADNNEIRITILDENTALEISQNKIISTIMSIQGELEKLKKMLEVVIRESKQPSHPE